MNYFYDNQIRRYLLQYLRIFSNIYVESAEDTNGSKTQSRVPVLWGDMSWMVAQIIKGASENTSLPSPLMSGWIVGLQMMPEERRDPAFESTIQAVERQFNQTTGEYTNSSGNAYTINRYMPVPYKMICQLDIWTTNTTTKLQILEQILTIFNPSVQLQQNDNRFDWTSIFEVELKDIRWTNRSIPQGSEMERDVASLTFELPIFINPAAKLKKQTIIEQIVLNVIGVDSVTEINQNEYDPVRCMGFDYEQIIVTPGNFNTSTGLNGQPLNKLFLRSKFNVADENLSWTSLLSTYGKIVEETQVRLLFSEDTENFTDSILATVSYDPNNANQLNLIYDLDSLPPRLEPVYRIVNPLEISPGFGLPIADIGQRYIITTNNGTEENILVSWGLVGYENDIIEYTDTGWETVFEASEGQRYLYINNLEDSKLYFYNKKSWSPLFQRTYRPGFWRIEQLKRN